MNNRLFVIVVERQILHPPERKNVKQFTHTPASNHSPGRESPVHREIRRPIRMKEAIVVGRREFTMHDLVDVFIHWQVGDSLRSMAR